MSGSLSISLEGVAEFEVMLKALGEEVGSKAIRDGAMRGGALVAAEAQLLAPVGETHRLSRTIHPEEVRVGDTRFAEVASGSGFAGVIVGPDREVYYGHFTEGGTKPHELATGRRAARRREEGRGLGFHPGIPGQRFMQRALDENADQVVTMIGEEIRKAVDAARAQ